MTDNTLLQVRGLQVWHRLRGGWFSGTQAHVRAVDGVDLDIAPGESLGLVGETGCGKSTLGRAIARLVEPQAGTIHLHGEDMLSLRGAAEKQARRRVQMIFQDPHASLNPRRSVEFSVTEPLIVHDIARGKDARRAAAEVLEWVGMSESDLAKYPHQLSGGQRQRVGFARAAILRPQLIVADEPVSALDMSVQAQTLNVMRDLQTRLGAGYLFISHDLAVVCHMCERVAVMYAGEIVEIAPRDVLFSAAAHPYTRGLLSSALPPKPGVKLSPIKGEAPGQVNPPAGCRFHPRCPHADEKCRTEQPLLRAMGNQHQAACHHAPIAATPNMSGGVLTSSTQETQL